MNEPIAYNQPTPEPTPKVLSAGTGGAIMTILIWIARQFFNIEIPAEVAAALAGIMAFGSAYMTKDKKPPQAVEEILKAEELKG